MHVIANKATLSYSDKITKEITQYSPLFLPAKSGIQRQLQFLKGIVLAAFFCRTTLCFTAVSNNYRTWNLYFLIATHLCCCPPHLDCAGLSVSSFLYRFVSKTSLDLAQNMTSRHRSKLMVPMILHSKTQNSLHLRVDKTVLIWYELWFWQQ